MFVDIDDVTVKNCPYNRMAVDWVRRSTAESEKSEGALRDFACLPRPSDRLLRVSLYSDLIGSLISLQPLKVSILKPSLKVISPNQVKVVVMEDSDFTTVMYSSGLCSSP